MVTVLPWKLSSLVIALISETIDNQLGLDDRGSVNRDWRGLISV